MRLLPIAALVLLLCACTHEQPQPAPALATPTPCPAAWTTLPPLPPSLVAPEPSLRVVAHTSASGTQDYECKSSPLDAGATFAWAPLGPEATLSDCSGAPVGRHFASEAGVAAPEWQGKDGSFVVAKKIGSEASKQPGAVAWLLLQASKSSERGSFGGVAYVLRTGTAGGAAGPEGCDAGHAGAVTKVPYSADYWFLGR